MAIPEPQLETWAKQGAVTTSKSTHEVIRRVLASDAVLGSKNLEVFLQGSYKNSTNIYADSDVDLVVQLNNTFGFDLSRVPLPGQQRFHFFHPLGATYRWSELHSDVLRALRAGFGAAAVNPGNKSIKVAGGSGRLAADVVPALQHRQYVSIDEHGREAYLEGITFYTQRDLRQVVNFPKQHYDNGVGKNASRTSGYYKPSSRMFKNARNTLIKRGDIATGLAPSYFVEGLFYNVPDSCFGTSYQHTYYNCVRWLFTADLASMQCQNGQLPLFGSTPEQWDTSSATILMRALMDLWNDW